MQKQIYTPEEEQKIMTRLWSRDLFNDPEAFVRFVFPWGKPNTPLSKKKGPRKWQIEVLRDIRDHITNNNIFDTNDMLRLCRCSGRGIGKSALVSWLIIWMLTTRIGSTVIVSANSESQLRSVTWGELMKWITMAIHSHWWEKPATKLVPAEWITELVEKDLKKGTRYWAAEGKLWSEENPDSFAGAHNHEGMMVIFDEASGIPDSIWSVAAGFFTEAIPDRYWFAFSNGRRPEGYFYDCFHSKADFWKAKQIDARDVEDTDKSIYAQIISEYGEDSNEARVEVYGQFPNIGDGQLISVQTVDAAIEREPYKDVTAPVIMGIDPAGKGKDFTCIQVRKGRDLLHTIRFKEDDAMAIVGRIISSIREYNPKLVVIDEGGLGFGISDRLKEQGFAVRGINFANRSSNKKKWRNKRAEIWCNMEEWLRTGHIPMDRKLKTELISQKYKYDSNGAVQLVSKEEMKSSPDSADALAMTLAFPMFKDSELVKSIPLIRKTYYHNTDTGWMGS